MGRSGFGSFRDDVVEATRIWAAAPLIPVVALALALLVPVLGIVDDAAGDLAGFAILATLGFFGAQRLVFERLRQGQPVTLGIVFEASVFYWGRFARLGLLMTAWATPGVIVVVLLFAGDAEAGVSAAPLVAMAAVFLVVDVLATFATCELTFTSDSASDAFRNGRRLLRETWTETKYHAMVPPLVPLVIGQLVAEDYAVAGVVVTAVGTVVAIIARGAHTIAYLRHRPVVAARLPRSVRGDHTGLEYGADARLTREAEQAAAKARRALREQDEPDLRTIEQRWQQRHGPPSD